MPRYPSNPKIAARKVFQEIEEHGEVKSPMIKRMFTRGNMLSENNRNVRDEIVCILWEMNGKDATALRKQIGISDSLVQKIIKERTKGKEQIAELHLEHEMAIATERYQGRKHLIDSCYEGAQRAIEHGVAQISDMKPLEAIKAGAILTDKALLLSGQPTSRVSKTDERMMGDEELEAKLRKYNQDEDKLKIVGNIKE